jgi:predicted Zn finger-like uncharacterized protein
MIIACPACATRYVVPDSAIGVEGRTVRCAKCKHSWFQDGPEIAAPEAGANRAGDASPGTGPAPASPAQKREAAPAPSSPEADARPHFGDAPPAAPRNAAPAAVADDSAAKRAAPPPPNARDDAVDSEPDFSSASDRDEPDADPAAMGPSFDEGDPPYGALPDAPPRPTVYDDTVSQFDYSPPFRPRRNYVKLWTWAAGIFAVLALGTVVAANTFGLPSWMPVDRPLFAVAEPDLELEFPVEEQERRTLPNGTEYFGARIIVTNTARETRDVPPILIVLRDGRERIVFSWEVTPPQASLAPGESMTINEAMTDVPRSAVFADIGWAPR